MDTRTRHFGQGPVVAGVLALAFVWLAATPAGAGTTAPESAADGDPAEVRQVTRMLRAELRLLLEADLVSGIPPDLPTPVAERRPRHVLQEARAVHEQVQTLRYLNGLGRQTLPPVPVRAIRPKDVHACVRDILADLRALRPTYEVTAEVATPPPHPGSDPTDVFRDLLWAQAALGALGLPAIVPNDAYRDARIALDEAQALAQALGLATVSKTGSAAHAVAERAVGKTPDDVYRLALSVLDTARALTKAAPGLRLSGGMLVPRPLERTARPADVRRVIRTLRAELNALKAMVGIATPALSPPVETGRTPSDVYDVVAAVGDLLTRLRAHVLATARPAGETAP